MLRLFIALFVFSFATLNCMEERQLILIQGLPLNGIGLEVAPFYRPTLLKSQCDICYTDYTTADDLIRKHSHLPQAQEIAAKTVAVDFIWLPGTRLADCVPNSTRFDYAIASHVIEHVPNVIGWLSQILDVVKIGGIVSLAIPDMRYTFDAYRQETAVHELIDNWLRDVKIPTPAQIYDMLSNSVDVGSQPDFRPKERGIPFQQLKREYTDEQALDYAISTNKTGSYLDIHCSTFTPESLVKSLRKIHDLGILNISVSEPILGQHEFFVQVTKLGESSIKHPNLQFNAVKSNVSQQNQKQSKKKRKN